MIFNTFVVSTSEESAEYICLGWFLYSVNFRFLIKAFQPKIF